MPIGRARFLCLREKYGHYSSWAIWAEPGNRPKSNVGDLRVLDPDQNPSLLQQLNPGVVLVGLNVSRGVINSPLANFHDARPEATDYKIRFALRMSPLWGAYMTDIIKDFSQKACGRTMAHLRANPRFEAENVRTFREEISDLGTSRPRLFSFGKDAHAILKKNLNQDFSIERLPHYANYSSKEKYRDQVQRLW